MGISDLAIGDKKISGNAQRRRKRFILHHGTLLYAIDPELMERYLIEPSDRPQYRGGRTHRGFIKCLPLDAGAVRDVFHDAFGCDGAAERPSENELNAVRVLARERFSAAAWIHRR
jgi:lipoate-protein ligase A